METILLYKLFESYGIQDLLPKIQKYVDEYDWFCTEGLKKKLDYFHDLRSKFKDKIRKIENIISKHEARYDYFSLEGLEKKLSRLVDGLCKIENIIGCISSCLYEYSDIDYRNKCIDINIDKIKDLEGIVGNKTTNYYIKQLENDNKNQLKALIEHEYRVIHIRQSIIKLQKIIKTF